MITAVDTSVLLDVLIDGSLFAAQSEFQLQEFREMGFLVVCEAVIAEIRPVFTNDQHLIDFLQDLQMEFIPSSINTILLARDRGYYCEYFKDLKLVDPALCGDE